jgi:hypothetical protein
VENDYNLLVHNLNELERTISSLRDEVEARRLREARERLEPNQTESAASRASRALLRAATRGARRSADVGHLRPRQAHEVGCLQPHRLLVRAGLEHDRSRLASGADWRTNPFTRGQRRGVSLRHCPQGTPPVSDHLGWTEHWKNSHQAWLRYAPPPGSRGVPLGRQPSICWYLNQLELDPGPFCHGEYGLVPSPQTKSPLAWLQ